MGLLHVTADFHSCHSSLVRPVLKKMGFALVQLCALRGKHLYQHCAFLPDAGLEVESCWQGLLWWLPRQQIGCWSNSLPHLWRKLHQGNANSSLQYLESFCTLDRYCGRMFLQATGWRVNRRKWSNKPNKIERLHKSTRSRLRGCHARISTLHH